MKFEDYFKAENFYSFLKEVLVFGFEKLQEKPHYEMCYFLANENGKNRRMLSVPRGCFKTTILNGYIVWDICRNLLQEKYDFNYLLDSATKQLVKWSLRFIKRRLEITDKLIEHFGEFKSKKYWGSESIVICQQEDLMIQMQRKEPTIMVSSVESAIVGFHFKNVMADDWVTDKTIRTPYAIERTKLHYKEIQNVLDDNGKLYMLCTFWDNNDIYSDILRHKRQEFDFLIEPIYKYEEEKIKLFFPALFNWTRIQQLKKELGSHFYTQYMLNPIPSDEKIFPDKHYHEIDRAGISNLKDVYIVYDPAGTSDNRKQHSLDCIAVIGVDDNYNQYLLDLVIKEGMRMDANTAIETIVYFAKKYDEFLKGIIVEKVLGSKFIKGLFDNYCRKNDLRYNMLYKEEQVDYEKSKKDRIRLLEVPWRNDQIFILRDIPEEMKVEAKEEFATFDRCRYYDILDAWAMVSKYIIFRKPEKKEDVKVEKSLFEVGENKISINMARFFEE